MNTIEIQPANRLNLVSEYYFSAKLSEIRRMNSQGSSIINLGIGDPDLPPSTNVIKSMLDAVIDPSNHGYQSYTGIPELRAAFSKWYKLNYDVNLNPDNEILPLLGSKEGIMHISLAFLNPGDEVLIPDPAYPTYQTVSNLCSATCRFYNLEKSNNWLPNLKEIEKKDLSKVKLMWVNYPNMPTGQTATRIFFEKLIAFGKKNKILIVNDNPYSLINTQKPLSILSVSGANDIAIELNSLSKSHNMAGWRVGMIAAKPYFIKTILKVKSNMDSGMFKPIQLAATEALSQTSDWFQKQKDIYAARKIIGHAILDTLNCSYNPKTSGMFLWAKIPPAFISSEQFSEMLLNESQVFITPGFIFGKNGEQYIRLSLANKEDILREAFQRITSVNYENIQVGKSKQFTHGY